MKALAASSAVVLFGTALLTAQQRPTFRSGVALVNFGVVVTDKQGTPVTGLSADDFEIKEEGKPQTIKFFAAGDPENAPTLHIGFLLDASGSMEDDIKDVRTAAIKFLNKMDRAEDITLVDFDSEVRMARYEQSSYGQLIERIRGRKTDGYTALYDALGVYLGGTVEQDGQKILIMYTDGGDTRSTLTLNDVLDLLKAADATVYVVGYLEHQRSSSRMQVQMELSQFAQTTGGLALFPTSIKEVEKMYDRIEREVAARYSLGYTSTDTRTNGVWRNVEIRLKRPDLKSARLRTRQGYFAPLLKKDGK
jgi:Ca-activated chloride channel family protein